MQSPEQATRMGLPGRASLPCTTGPESSGTTTAGLTDVTLPSSEWMWVGYPVSSVRMPRGKYAVITYFFSSPAFSVPLGPALYHFSQRFCLAFLSGIFGSTSAWWGAEGLKHKVSDKL